MAAWREAAVIIRGDATRIPLPDCSVDAVVTDPPYEYAFMSRAWDSLGVAFSVDTWREVYRVMKPGAHLLSFGGTRTYHRMTCAIEDAGFEVRDCLAWLYGSGFPKSLDVSKAIDKRAEENVATKRRIAAVAAVVKQYREAKRLTRQEVSQAVVGTPSGACWNWEHHQLPSEDLWPSVKAVLDIPDKFDGLVAGDRARFIAAEREVVGFSGHAPSRGAMFAPGVYEGLDSLERTAPATPEAEQWQGWGTALAPSHEPIVLARKPLVGTVAANVTRFGTGALNVDGCRTPEGRWPKNTMLDEEAARLLDEQSGERSYNPPAMWRTDGPGVDGTRAFGKGVGKREAETVRGGYGDTGGASRFFYVAKASSAERNRGLVKPSSHPTVKPLALMRWLVRLVTPPNGLVLDPFLGSGTTLLACAHEGMRGIGIEREAEYVEIAKGRLSQPIQAGML